MSNLLIEFDRVYPPLPFVVSLRRTLTAGGLSFGVICFSPAGADPLFARVSWNATGNSPLSVIVPRSRFTDGAADAEVVAAHLLQAWKKRYRPHHQGHLSSRERTGRTER